MTREEKEEIKQRCKEIDKRLVANRQEHDKIVADLKALQGICSHPDLKPISHQGESALWCPLCGYES